MSFTSIPFYLFAALTLLLYYVLPRRFQWIVLLVMSLVFYASWGLELIPFVLVASLAAWFCARKMETIYAFTDVKIKTAKEAGENPPARTWKDMAKKQCRRWLWLAFAVLIMALIFVKLQRQMATLPVLSWIPWFFSKVYHHFGKLLIKLPGSQLFLKDTIFSDHGRMAETVSILVPLGISYYTFSLISYVTDVYWKKDKAEQNYFRLLAFTLYFPKILQGPISRHRELAPQIFEGHTFDYQKLCFGLQRMLWGYFKKLVIADRLAIFVGIVNNNVENETGAHLLVGAVFATLQLYCDFSGCMDIACGFSECLGLTLEENFNRPFFSRSIGEFWSRWHITLGAFFKDYVYMPIVVPHLLKHSKLVKKKYGERASRAVLAIPPLLAVWMLTGIWHGMDWAHVVWGMYFFCIITISTVFKPEFEQVNKRLKIKEESAGWKVFQTVRTATLFIFGGMATRYGTLEKGYIVIKKIFTSFHVEGFFDGSLYTLELSRPGFLLAILALFLLYAVGRLQEQGISLRERIADNNLLFRWIVYYGLLFSIIIFGIYGPGYDAKQFIYMQF